jgi:hypothetical protein
MPIGLHRAAQSEAAKSTMTGTSKSPGCPDPRAILHHSKAEKRRNQMSAAIRLGSALAFCLPQTALAQDMPGQKLGNLRFCDSPYEIVVVTNDDTLWESRVKTNTCFEMYATYTLDPSRSPRPARIEGRIQYVVKVSVNMEGREHRVAVGFAIFDDDPLADRRPRA